MPLIKILCQTGLGARRAMQTLIAQGAVSVDGQAVTDGARPFEPHKHKICLYGEPIPMGQAKVYYLLNKPKGYVCSHKAQGKKVFELFEQTDLRLFSVGRLDRDTTGLLLITNDGDFAQRIAHPRNQIAKEYLVKANKEVEDHHLKAISQGAQIDGRWVKPERVVKVRRASLKVVVTDGRKHEVKELMAAAELQVVELTRIRIGGLLLGALAPGHWRVLKPSEQAAIFQ